ncbi:hypothetical protein PENSPDRAFT_92945 [Peniophora sp. CONT]|nr:hypothetical protein PENSPDRAFT_92945 [Peniophora sp. CONT]
MQIIRRARCLILSWVSAYARTHTHGFGEIDICTRSSSFILHSRTRICCDTLPHAHMHEPLSATAIEVTTRARKATSRRRL